MTLYLLIAGVAAVLTCVEALTTPGAKPVWVCGGFILCLFWLPLAIGLVIWMAWSARRAGDASRTGTSGPQAAGGYQFVDQITSIF